MTTLVESLHLAVSGEVIAAQAKMHGESERNSALALRSAAATVLAALALRCTNQDAIKPYFDEIAGADNLSVEPAHFEGLFEPPDERLLPLAIARFSGVSESSAQQFIRIAKGLVRTTLKSWIAGEGLTLETFQQRLLESQDALLAKIPAAAAGLLGIPSRQNAGPVKRSGSRWLLWLLLATALVLLRWFFR